MLYRVLEGSFLTAALPLLLQEDAFLYFDAAALATSAALTAASSAILLVASATILNRTALVTEARTVGSWRRLGPGTSLKPDGVACGPDSGVATGAEVVLPPWERPAKVSGFGVLGRGYGPGDRVSHRESCWEALVTGSGAGGGAGGIKEYSKVFGTRCEPGDRVSAVAFAVFAPEVRRIGRRSCHRRIPLFGYIPCV